MVGVVLVSHSAVIASGLSDLLAQVAGGAVPVATAGGTPDGRLGTSADLVAEAVGAAESGDGVVVLADLGSAVMSCRVALEDLVTDDGTGGPAPRAVLVDAPFVEGAVAAAVTASTGADLDAVVAAAEQARTVPKL